MTQAPTPLREHRPDLPEGLALTLAKMLAKKAEDRFQRVEDVWEALRNHAPATLHLPPLEDDARRVTKTQAFSSEPSTVSAPQSPPASEGKTSALQGAHPTTSPLGEARNTAVSDTDVMESLQPGSGEATHKPLWLWLALVALVIGAAGAFWALTRPPETATTSAPTQKQATPANSRQKPTPGEAIAPLGDAGRPPERRLVLRANPPVIGKHLTPRAPIRRAVPRRPMPRRMRRRPIPRRRGHMCGALKAGQRWVVGRLRKPQRGHLRLKFLGCPGCRLRRRSGALCLLLPRSKKVEVRLLLNSYQSCRHWIGRGQRKLGWSLKFEDPDALPNERYPCVSAQ